MGIAGNQVLYDHHETMLQCSSETGLQGIKLLVCNSVPGYSFDHVRGQQIFWFSELLNEVLPS